MALSGSTNYSLNRTQLINSALRIINVYTEAQTPSSFEMASAAETLNLMLKAMQADGLQLTTRRTKSFSLVSGTASYTLGPSGTVTMDRPLRILACTLKQTSTGDETQLWQTPRIDYHNLSLKTTAGTPVQFMYDPQLTNGVIYFWPVMNTTGYTAELLYLKPYDDLDSSTDDIELPQEWLEAVKYGLAARLADEYGMPLQERSYLWRRAEERKADVDGFDVETTSVFITPDYS